MNLHIIDNTLVFLVYFYRTNVYETKIVNWEQNPKAQQNGFETQKEQQVG